MRRFVEGEDRRQATLLPECLDDYVSEENPVRAVDAFVDALDLAALGSKAQCPRRRAGPPTTPARC
jgi:transposase